MSVYYFFEDEKPYNGFALYGKLEGELWNSKAKERWRKSANKILQSAITENNGKPFQVMTDMGPVIFINPSLADEIRNDDRLDFNRFLHRMFLTQYPGLDAVASLFGDHSEIFTTTIRKNLTQSLGAITADLSETMKAVMKEHLAHITTGKWQEVKFVPFFTQVAARLSNRVFLGKELGASKEWLVVSTRYTIDFHTAVRELRMIPPFARWLVHWFMPSMRVCRKHLRTARSIIEPEISLRKKKREQMLLEGEKTEKPMDSLSWFLDNAKGEPFDYTMGQVAMGFAAIHTTSSMMAGLLGDLAENPDVVDQLRKEIAEVLRVDGGWKKTSLYKMKLLDSCMKESQRLHPITAYLMIRAPVEDMILSDGTCLPKDSMVAIPSIYMKDPSVYGPTAEIFDGYRFLRLREQSGQENKWQFVTPSSEMFGFGFGKNACPGRFFASNEVKIALAHLLMMYDWKFDETLRRPGSLRDSNYAPDPSGGVWCKARIPEVSI